MTPGTAAADAARSGARAFVAIAAVFSLVLRQLWQPVGAQKLADAPLHDVMPVVALLDWFRHVPRHSLAWAHVPRFTLMPLAYSAYAIVRGVDFPPSPLRHRGPACTSAPPSGRCSSAS